LVSATPRLNFLDSGASLLRHPSIDLQGNPLNVELLLQQVEVAMAQD